MSSKTKIRETPLCLYLALGMGLLTAERELFKLSQHSARVETLGSIIYSGQGAGAFIWDQSPASQGMAFWSKHFANAEAARVLQLGLPVE